MSSPEPSFSDDDPRLRMAVFRYGVIADLVTHVLDRGELTELVREAARRRYHLPGGTEATFSERTIWSWLVDYRRTGMNALLPARRRDAGQHRALTPEALSFAIALRREDRARSAGDVLDMLERAGKLAAGAASRQTVDRALRRLGLERIRPGRKPERVRRRIQVDGPNALWVGDYHDPIAIPLFDGGFLRCHIGAFVDHYSRFVPYGAYYPSQAIYTLEDVFKKAVLRAGAPSLIYVDNAKIYRSAAFAFACSRIETELTHSQAYESEGRGVIERLWGTFESFERELVHRGVKNLAEVNTLFWAWLEERYHDRVHEETKARPSERREGFTPTFPPLDRLSELFLVKVKRTVNRRLSTVEVDGVAFHVDPSLRDKLVQVHYDPHDLSSVVVYFDGRRIQRAERALPNTAPPTPTAPAPVATGFDYLGKILIDHERRRAREARPISFVDLEPAAVFDLAAFERHLEVATGRPLSAADRALSRDFHERFGPLHESVVTDALERAQKSRGHGLHLTVYLDFVKAFHLDKGGTP